MKRKIFYKKYNFQIITIFFVGISVGVIAIWPGILSENSRKCFINFLLDVSDGSVRMKTLLSINSNYLLKN